MKKVMMSLLMVGLFGGAMQASSITQEPPHKSKVTHNKATRTTEQGAKKAGKGAKHGAYDVSHNKVTKKTHVK